jgi:hypothetical protein
MIIIDFSFCDYFSFILLKLITCFKNILSRVAYDSKRKSTLLKEVRPLLQRRPPFPPGMQRRMMPGMPPQNGFGQQPGNFGQFNPLQQFRNFAQQTNAQQSFYPNQQGLNRGGGNFLTRLFRRGGNRNIPFQQAAAAAPRGSLFSGLSGAQGAAGATNSSSLLGGLQGLTNPANLSSMMGNVQRVLKAAETMGPMIQQYGPLVKNAPSLWKIYQALRSSDDTDEVLEAEGTEVSETDESKDSKVLSAGAESTDSSDDELDFFEEEIEHSSRDRVSKPKLYI